MKSPLHAFWLLALLGGCASRPAAPLWNLPPLIGQPMDVAQKTLGKPDAEVATTPGLMQSQWKRGDVTLSATWKTSSQRVINYDLVSRDDAQALREGETAELLVPGQLKASDPAYSTEWIESTTRPLYYTGVKVIPTPKSHAVVIRVSGSEALIHVLYQVTPSGKSDDLLTIAPWEASFTLSDDAAVSISAGLYKSLNKEPVQLKVEILKDGKVMASDAATGRVVRRNLEL